MGVATYPGQDKDYSFDKARTLTPFEHVVVDHEESPLKSREAHFIEWVRDVEKAPADAMISRAAEVQATNYSIHFHVWDALSFIAFLSHSKHRYSLPLMMCAVVADPREIIVVLKKDGMKD